MIINIRGFNVHIADAVQLSSITIEVSKGMKNGVMAPTVISSRLRKSRELLIDRLLAQQ